MTASVIMAAWRWESRVAQVACWCRIDIMRRKATENNRLFGSTDWTPRKIDKILWTFGR